MVRGLDVFRDWFAEWADHYVLIGGTAATLTMDEAGIAFRATRDLDIVLHVEALTPAFGQAFWNFVAAGGYAIRQVGDTGRPVFYRFQKPSDERFPSMLELFARTPPGVQLAHDAQLTPIPLGEAVSGLSAILLDDAYYDFILMGRREVDGLPWVGEDRLIPLKAIAWLELSARKAEGAAVDSKDIAKHLKDVLRLSQLLTPTTRISLDARIARDMTQFLAKVGVDTSIDPKALRLGNVTVTQIAERIAKAYGLAWPG